jgi:hypothetical protein
LARAGKFSASMAAALPGTDIMADNDPPQKYGRNI